MADDLKLPKSSNLDYAHAVTRASLSAIPVIGGPLTELFQSIVQPPLEKRRNEWTEEVTKRLIDLENQGVLQLEDLKDNQEFVSGVTQITQIALRTHIEEKLEALRNALLNIAQGSAPDEVKQQIFLNHIERLTSLHIQLLKVFQDPTPPPGMSMGGLMSVVEHSLPHYRNERELVGQAWSDLYSVGLVNTQGLNTTMSEGGLAQKRTNPLGDEFISFISEQGTNE